MWHDGRMPRTRKARRLVDAYTFRGFCPRATVQGLFGDPLARLVTLVRREKSNLRHGSSRLVRPHAAPSSGSALRAVRDLPELEVRRVDCRQCGRVKRERLEFLLENTLHTERIARYIGRRCRTGTIKDVAKDGGSRSAACPTARQRRAHLDRGRRDEDG